MSNPKLKTTASDLQLFSDKEVAILLERLIDSVVVEVTAHRSALQPQQVIESNDDALDIDSLPDEIIEKVFGYLKQNQLGQIARVCRRWNVLTKSPGLWKTVNRKIFSSHRSQTAAVEFFINKLPSCVTSIRLNFTKYRNQIVRLKYEKLCVKLQEKRPHLNELMLANSEISDSFPVVIVLCSQFLQNVKNLVFHRCLFSGYSAGELCGTSKIALLDLSWCRFKYNIRGPDFSRMPDLKVLCLFGTDVPVSWFPADTSFLKQLHVLNVGCTDITPIFYKEIQNNGLNLNELYLCLLYLPNNYLKFNSAFPNLQRICLADNYVTCDSLVSLIQPCPSLENVYVRESVAKSFAVHPFVVANRCKAGIVKAIDWNHIHEVDYSHSLLDITLTHNHL